MISGIVLAAGAAQRMGKQKLFLDLQGKPVLQWVLEAATESALAEVICVVRNLEQTMSKVSFKHPKLRWVINEKAHEGQSTSVIAGLKAVVPQSEGALFLVADQPLVKTSLIDALINLFERSSPLIGVPLCAGQTRNPVLFHKELFPELLKLTGDKGGRKLLETYRERAAFLEWKDEALFLDLDTVADYEKLRDGFFGTDKR